MPKGPMSAEAKKALMEKLMAGRAKKKAAREEAKAKGLPDPHPRKPRTKKGAEEAIPNPASAPAANEKIAPISGAPRNEENKVAAKPVDPTATKTTPIDVPNLPGEDKKVDSKKDIVKDAEAIPEAKPKKGLSSTGRPTKVNVNHTILNEETGNQAIEAQYPGQKESIEKMLSTNKHEDRPISTAPNAQPLNVTVKKVKTHIPDIKAVEEKAPFSYSAMRKLLHQ